MDGGSRRFEMTNQTARLRKLADVGIARAMAGPGMAICWSMLARRAIKRTRRSAMDMRPIVARRAECDTLACGGCEMLSVLIIIELPEIGGPKLPRSFSLSAMLIATAMLAVALGVICYTVQ